MTDSALPRNRRPRGPAAVIVDRNAALRRLMLDEDRSLGDALEPWQLEHVLGPIFATAADGSPLYRLLDFELHRGAGKTTLLAAVALVELLAIRHGRIFAFAADEDQARLLLEAAAGFIRRSGLEREFSLDRRTIRARRSGAELRVMSADAASAYGLTGDLFVCDEVAQWQRRELWDAIYTAMAKKPTAQLLVISTPGWSRSSIAWEVREAARSTPGYYLYAPGVRVASWLDAAELERQRAALSGHVFRRQHLGQWSEGDGAFITADDLARCIRPARTRRTRCSEPGQHVLAVDLGLKNDRTAVAVVHRSASGVVLDLMQTWQGSRAVPVSITEDVEPFIRECIRDFPNLRVVLDPWQSQSTYERLRAHVRIEPFTFSGANIDKLTWNLYAVAHNGQLELYPDPELERELLDVQVIEREYGLRIDHRSGRHDDRVIALGMAAQIAMAAPRHATVEIAF